MKRYFIVPSVQRNAMEGNQSRRTVLKGIGGALASAAALGAAGTAAAKETTKAGSDLYYDPAVEFTAASYDGADRKGALLEAIKYDTASCLIGDVHYIVDDGDDTYDVRDDAADSDVGVTVGGLDEAYLSTQIPVANGEADLYQQAFVNETDNAPSLLIENDLELPAGGDYTVATLANPELGDEDNDAHLVSEGYYDVLVVTDGTDYVAFAQRETWRKAFDDQQVGIEATSESAWENAYVDGDAALDTNTSNSGDVDLAFTLAVGDREQITWTTAIGFGTTEADAVDRAVGALEAGFDSERQDSLF
ncbi:hypothetical protein GJ629_09385 [Halapricum sp. CBA1109]|nr:hypothetical protein [Halapricum sp. CBA1109]